MVCSRRSASARLKKNFLDLAPALLADLSDEEGDRVFDAVLDDMLEEMPPERREWAKKNKERVMKGQTPEPWVN